MFKIPKQVIGLLLCLVAQTSNATLMSHLSSQDYLAAGDGLLTLDISTGLEWLDLSVTAGNSILDTEAESFFSPSAAGGFRWATFLEITALMSHLPYVSFSAGEVLRQSFLATDVAAAETFINLLSPTHVVPTQMYVQGLSRGHVIDDRYGTGYVLVDYIQQGADFTQTCRACSRKLDEEYYASYIGSWLVRGEEATTIPIPTTLALFGLGLAGLGLARRNKA